MRPIPSISQVTTSPRLRKQGGSIPIPTPAGVPVMRMVPAGVGMGMDPPCFLKRGDVVTCEIDGIGRISNPIR